MLKKLLSTLATHDTAIITQIRLGKHIYQEVLELRTNRVILQKTIAIRQTTGQGKYYGKHNNIHHIINPQFWRTNK